MLQLPTRKSFVTLLLLMLAAISIWLFEEQPDKGPTLRIHSQSTPSSYMENFITTVLSAQGHTQYQLQAVRMAHYADDDHSELIQPQFTAFRPNGQRWTMVAETGRTLKGAEQIMLNGRVTIQRNNDAVALPDLEIRTRDVQVRPADDYAETAQHTTIVHGQGASQATIEAVGLQVHFRKGQLTLLSQVRGVYAP